MDLMSSLMTGSLECFRWNENESSLPIAMVFNILNILLDALI